VAVGNNGVLYVADTNMTENCNPTPGPVVIVDSQGNSAAVEVDYVRTTLPNLTTDSQHDLRFAIGVTYLLHR
jgi:hypothetical protein